MDSFGQQRLRHSSGRRQLIKQAIALIRKQYCKDNSIKDPSTVSFELHTRKPSGEYVFLVRQNNELTSYLHPRVDLSKLTGYEGLTVMPGDYSGTTPSKLFIVNLLKSKIGYQLLEEDISFVNASQTTITVGIAKDSMRYSGDFSIRRG